MGHVENKVEWCLRKAEKEGEKHRGLKKITPDAEKSNKHIQKAQHNLKAMLYMIKGNFFDWAVSSSFYAMYHCLLAILAKEGYESRNQECTFAAVEMLITEGKIDLDVNLLKRITSSDEKLEGEEIINLREEFQYGTDTIMEDERVKKLVEETKEFIDKVRVALK
ncbi:MAG: HEPN domain-containing protein [Nanoarchaeota archaeon]|nr:HEPN domain-containing protein [Nanoarchaeota archaeon]